MLLLRTVTRLIEMILMLILALAGLALALYCLDGFIRLGAVRPDRLLHLAQARDHVGHFLTQLEAPGPTAALALLCGLVAMLLGAILLWGLLGSRRQRLVWLEQNGDQGTLAARPGAIRSMTRGLAVQASGVTAVKRPRLRLSRAMGRGRLTVTAARARTEPAEEVKGALQKRVAPVTEPFGLRPRIRVHVGGQGERVQ